MARFRIPFNRPYATGREAGYMAEAVASGQISGDGIFSGRCHAILEKALGVEKALLTTSCTHALEMASMLLDLRPGDEVVVPSFTFVSTANAFVLRGARPVFADIRPDTLNLDENRLESLLSPRTRAVFLVHYAGIGCEMDAIMEVARLRGVRVVEDNAHGLFGKYKGKYLGTMGCLGTQSFHETKNFSCGEGGALLINDTAYLDRAEIIREKGTNRTRFFRGQVDKYTWVDIGSSYLPSDLLAAFLFAQLEERERIQEIRRRIWERYALHLGGWAQGNGIRLPTVPPHCEQAYHMFYLLLPSLQSRQAFIAHMRQRGILCVFHYLPLHLSDMGRAFGGKEGDCPVTETTSDRLVRLPFFNSLSLQEQEEVMEAVMEFRP